MPRGRRCGFRWSLRGGARAPFSPSPRHHPPKEAESQHHRWPWWSDLPPAGSPRPPQAPAAPPPACSLSARVTLLTGRTRGRGRCVSGAGSRREQIESDFLKKPLQEEGKKKKKVLPHFSSGWFHLLPGRCLRPGLLSARRAGGRAFLAAAHSPCFPVPGASPPSQRPGLPTMYDSFLPLTPALPLPGPPSEPHCAVPAYPVSLPPQLPHSSCALCCLLPPCCPDPASWVINWL